ncbi:uncharacterized protein LOC133783644 [Humulus lupulus]|uniref:uncharacterized protein LOC133783644 n=1 Tax=Humulus lupulus TaxID=3486 RepID=UPI002B40F43E|nr:uncharacterized protein LOC133783644 [Humulus lupulus]XP_062079283.1 uncharacterized protein LOC133783644 [Humulus lupulus]XP_062079288.1 uncharacterized protein LOC133783644 [Humulus lupulus]XP_062079295.1 uncharacterized protein LOC133783644 [Humulus lupulus]
MNVTQRRKANGNGEKPFPGCLGRMVNLFDLSNGVASNRMLTDRPHHDGSSLGRSQSDVARMSSPFGDKIEDKLIVSEFRRTLSNKKANGTPIKMLIDQEMSKEIESKSEPPNVVAKLMGLDAFPRQHPHPSLQRSNTNNYSKPPFSHSGMPLSSWQQEDGFSENRMQFDVHHCPERNEYKDVYEVWQQPENKTCIKDKSPQKERHNANTNTNDRNMALVRQKFAEAKRLATDEKLRQSEEFKEALEVLNSNRDLLIKIFNESTPAFSQHLYELQSMPPPPETKRITVLRPSKIVDKEKISGSRPKSDKPTDNFPQLGQTAMLDKNNPENSPMFSDQKVDEYPMQPTRIVVLKPSSGKTHDIRAVTQPIASSKLFHEQNIYEDPEDDEARESREVAKEITRHVRDNLMGHHRDETLLSSVFSNGYTGDESSFNKSEIEYVAEILSDQEVMSPSSRHSWDYINRIGSPFSSSFSRASCSPESSVCREAKKRLSERWAMMASTSNGNSQEFRHVRRSSSTLGEMLALSDMKKSVRPDEINKEQEPRKLVSCLTGDSIKEDDCNSPKSLLRSQSLPVSSTVFGARLNMSISDAVADRTDGPKELTKAKSTKSSLKGKVSSLFFSRSKKSSKEKSGSSGPNGESQYASAETPRFLLPPGKIDAVSQSSNEIGLEERLPSVSCLSGIVSREGGLSLTKPTVSRGVGENQDQPSPISVLEPHFEEYETSGYLKLDVQGGLLRSNLIDKSPPIESIARTLSWDDSCVETATSYTLKPSSVPIVCEEDEQEWLAFVQTLLSAAGLSRETGSDTQDSVLHRWQTPEAPLDPSLRDKYANVDDKEPMHEAKRRYLRSTRKLVFDYVNTALAEVTGYGPDTSLSITCNGAHDRLLEGDSSPLLVDCLWGQMKDWFSGELRCCWEDGGDAASLVVDGVVRKEIVGKGWNELTRLEMDNIGKEIEGSLMETLMKEAVVDLTGRF